MIRFFRTIRQRLIEEGQLKKYLIYAIGEVLLIVVGIFIALQLNNWNDYRKQRQSEKEYYCKLLEDLNQDSLNIIRLIQETEGRLTSSNRMLHFLQQSSPKQEDVVREMLGAISKTTFTFKPSTTAFDDLKSAGNLKLLRDVALKDSLTAYYSALEGYIDVIDVNADATVAAYYEKDDFVETGWQHMPFVRSAIDTTLVRMDLLEVIPYPTDKHRRKMLSDAVLFIGTNARTQYFYTIVKEKILRMRQLLLAKCSSQ
jgi:hypothetical protein